MRLTPLRADSLLFLIALIWGGTFIAQRQAMVQEVTPLAFNGMRYLIGALTVVPLLLFTRRIRPDESSVGRRIERGNLLWGGVLIGVVSALAAGFQQVGMVHTQAGPAAFITGLYVLFTPVIGFMLGVRTQWSTWLGAGLAVIGMWFLAVTHGEDGSFQLKTSELLILVGAMLWAVQVLAVGRFAPRTDPIELVLAQLIVAALCSFLAEVIAHPTEFASNIMGMFRKAPFEIIFTGVLATGVAFPLQIIAQRKSPPSHVAVILATGLPFAALGGWLILSESYDGRQILGGLIMLVGILTSQVPRLLASGRTQ